MFFKEKVETSEVIKWGVFAGLLEGAYLGIATVLYAQKSLLMALTDGWQHFTTLFLLLLIVISAIITSIIVFAHPLYSFMQKKYAEGVLTLVTTVIALVAVLGFMLFIFEQLFI
jgi:hypothetical protein